MVTCIILGAGVAAILPAKAGGLGSTLNIFPAALSFTALTILSYSLCSKRILGWLKNRIIFVAHISYELYLIHGSLVTSALKFLFSNFNHNLVILLNFLVILPFAVLLAFLFSRLNKQLYRALL